MKNLITDVAGIGVGHASDAKIGTGTTAIVFEEPAVVAVDVRGGAPGTIETDLLEPHRTLERIDAVVLSGGSAFGLEAASGVQAWLREQDRGFAFAAGDIRVLTNIHRYMEDRFERHLNLLRSRSGTKK